MGEYKGFKISDAARFCGFSKQGLRFLEQKSVVAPTLVNEETGYRYYDLFEIGRILRVKLFRSFGFTLDETVELTKSPSVDDALCAFAEKQAEIADNMRRERALLALMGKRSAIVASIPACLGVVREAIMPAYHNITYAALGVCTTDQHVFDLIATWNNLAPLAHSMPYFVLRDDGGWEPLSSSLGIFDDDAVECGIVVDFDDPAIVSHPSKRALVTILRANHVESEREFTAPGTTPFSAFDSYLGGQGLVADGDCVLFPILTTREEGHDWSYWQVWMPVKNARENGSERHM